MVGGAICALALYLMYSGAVLIDANLTSGSFNLRFWDAWFWLKHPPSLEHGLADNGKSWLEILSGAIIAAIGWGTIRMGRHE
jgi:hypothetical protein